MTTFDISRFRNLTGSTPVRYQRRINELQEEGMTTTSIESAVDHALRNIAAQVDSFVIYGEPQSGKTEMMIALTARLLDEGHRVVVILLNDSVQLLEQNLERFLKSGLDPAPKKFDEILDPSVSLAGSNWVVFCKKNGADLTKLNDKLGSIKGKVVIDDEADYATPNGKVNRVEEMTRIYELVRKLLGESGIYIGVTATPGRLDVNHTFDNDNTRWVDFKPHPKYTGQDVFFPATKQGLALGFNLELLPDVGDDPKYLRTAFFGFLVNVAFLNLKVNEKTKNYCMLIHTSGRRDDHQRDQQQIAKLLSALRNRDDPKFEKYVRAIFDRAARRYPGSEDDITAYIVEHIGQSDVIVMNSNVPKNASTYRRATEPAALFTIAIGGNIVSRGVTFDNLLSMFFTRDVKHKLQLDTYIQRARMFGSRGGYLQYFELHIPRDLYFDWQRCFVLHRLALSSIRAGMGSPVWVEGSRVVLTAANSIDRARVVFDSGEMSWDLFVYADEMDEVVDSSETALERLSRLSSLIGQDGFPSHVVRFVEDFLPAGDNSIAVHTTTLLTKAYATADIDNVVRAKGFMASNTLEPLRFPKAIHHFKIFRNPAGKARIFYKYTPGADTVRFLTRPA